MPTFFRLEKVGPCSWRIIPGLGYAVIGSPPFISDFQGHLEGVPQPYLGDLRSPWLLKLTSPGMILQVLPLKLTAKATENGWLEDEISFWDGLFSRAMCKSLFCPHLCPAPKKTTFKKKTAAPLPLFSVSRGMRMEAPRLATPYLKSVMAQVSCLPGDQGLKKQVFF